MRKQKLEDRRYEIELEDFLNSEMRIPLDHLGLTPTVDTDRVDFLKIIYELSLNIMTLEDYQKDLQTTAKGIYTALQTFDNEWGGIT